MYKGTSQLPRHHQEKEPDCQWKRLRFDPQIRKIPWRRAWKSTPVFLPGKSHGQRSLGYSPQSSTVSDTTKVTQHACTHEPPPYHLSFICIMADCLGALYPDQEDRMTGVYPNARQAFKSKHHFIILSYNCSPLIGDSTNIHLLKFWVLLWILYRQNWI